MRLLDNQYIKAMNKNMTCLDHKFEVGKEYKIDGSLELCHNGFHACKDIDDTLNYYDVDSIFTLVTFLGDVIHDEDMDKSVTNHIRIDKVLSFEECVELDNNGDWCYIFAHDVKGADIKLLQSKVIEKDGTGRLCYRFARDVKGADIKLLQSKVIEKDITGEWCYYFARDVKGADIELLQSKLHPYEHIVEEMEYRGWTYNDLSDASGLSEEDTKKLLEGKLFIDGDVAESLSRAFGTSKEVWLNLQNKYRGKSDK